MLLLIAEHAPAIPQQPASSTVNRETGDQPERISGSLAADQRLLVAMGVK